MELPKQNYIAGDSDSTKAVQSVGKFSTEHSIYTFAIAKILYELSFTHEYNELPVRHNEEELNLELSRGLPWGYDLGKVSFWMDKKKPAGANILDIMLDPHTKCFLLLQAYIFKSKLPISDYINDMRSVVEQVPRLLAAMQYVALDDDASAGNFDMISAFPLVRRIFATGTMINSKPPHNGPSVKLGSVRVDRELKKSSHHHVGFVDLNYNIKLGNLRRNNQRKTKQDKGAGQGVTIALGTLAGGYLLNHTSFNVPMPKDDKHWKKNVRLAFDWTTAEVNGGDDGVIVMRIIHEFVHGSDLEVLVSLKR